MIKIKNRYQIILLYTLITGLIIANLLIDNYEGFTALAVFILLSLAWVQFHHIKIYVKQLKSYEQVANQVRTTYDFMPISPLVMEQDEIFGIEFNHLMRFIQQRELQTRVNMEMVSSVTRIIEAPLVIINVNGKIDYANNSFKQWFNGREVEQVHYKNIGNRGLRRIMQDALICETTRKSELQMNERYYTSTSSPVYDEQQLFKGIIILFHDITDLKKYQNLQKEFFGNASHELKTPITAIKGCTEILLAGEHNQDTMRDFLEIIHNENERLERLVKDLLLINRYDFAQIKLKKQKLCLNDLILQCMTQVENISALKQQQIVFQATHEVNYKGDFSTLQQCFLNLLTNAIHYSGNKTIITLKLKKERKLITIQVIDQGIGISEKELPHIFERFYRVDKARSRHTGGSGLGLAIVKSIIEAHGGVIKVESVQDQGTIFTVKL